MATFLSAIQREFIQFPAIIYGGYSRPDYWCDLDHRFFEAYEQVLYNDQTRRGNKLRDIETKIAATWSEEVVEYPTETLQELSKSHPEYDYLERYNRLFNNEIDIDEF